ncbi:MAG: NAD(P)-dependent oxidoreductase [SAR324 cluster bacterium]|nr:NAD(P)-dependent oxidoreductase [SAR324 cluster bacterium]
MLVSENKIFVAGATGAVGRFLCPLLVNAGYRVYGMTRKQEKSEFLQSLDVEPVIADVYDGAKLSEIMQQIKPSLVLHQLTDLPYGVPEKLMVQGRIDNEKIRDIGTRNLVISSLEAGVERIIAQSICFMYDAGSKPIAESSRLASENLQKFENQILSADLEGTVLRYGVFYGPHTGVEVPVRKCSVHVHAAAYAGLLAVTRGKGGVFNIAEDDGEVSIKKATEELAWDPNFRVIP